ncbi:sensor histidine kinase [Micromonospora coxensis]|uniref:histidine kinase n=1 Tax=Micromonospora coxensis TaxID=356852 RepID=A0A1C5I2P7_9ACTN|nr:histidine kinase [Micromonospora coxensis]SCG52548.1 Signal transduction histidine kinase [Micromonospora coxensis]
MGRLRGWWPELLLGLTTAVLGYATTRLTVPAVPREEWAGAFAVAAGLVLVGVRRAPWAVLAVESVLLLVADTVTPTGADNPQLAAGIALGFVAYRTGWAATVAGLLLFWTVTLVNVIDPGNEQILAGGAGAVRLVMLAAMVTAPVAFGRYLRGVRTAARVAEERVREAESRRAAETLAARLAERAMIARDLHDILAHHIGAIALRAGSARYAVQHTGRTDEAVTALGELRDTAAHVLDELRELLDVLRDPETVEPAAGQLEPEQLIRDAEQVVREAGVAVGTTMSPALSATPLVLRTTAARVVRESLTNTLKHAGPGAVASVDIRVADGALLVEVRDSGPERPRPALPPSGYGLAGMRERVGLLGGTLTAGPTPGGGWRVRVRLPIRENT